MSITFKAYDKLKKLPEQPFVKDFGGGTTATVYPAGSTPKKVESSYATPTSQSDITFKAYDKMKNLPDSQSFDMLFNDGTGVTVHRNSNASGIPNVQEANATVTPTLPTYKSAYADRINSLIDTIAGQKSFSYDPEADPTYSNYRKQYLREGKRAIQDTLGSYAGMTGGIPSSYAVTAAGQAGNYYNTQLTDKIPQLEELAYSRYLAELNNKYNQLNTLVSLDNNDYQRYLNEQSIASANRDYEIQQQRYADELARSDRDYNAQQQRYADELARSDRDYNAQQQRYADELARSDRDYNAQQQRYADAMAADNADRNLSVAKYLTDAMSTYGGYIPPAIGSLIYPYIPQPIGTGGTGTGTGTGAGGTGTGAGTGGTGTGTGTGGTGTGTGTGAGTIGGYNGVGGYNGLGGYNGTGVGSEMVAGGYNGYPLGTGLGISTGIGLGGTGTGGTGTGTGGTGTGAGAGGTGAGTGGTGTGAGAGGTGAGTGGTGTGTGTGGTGTGTGTGGTGTGTGTGAGTIGGYNGVGGYNGLGGYNGTGVGSEMVAGGYNGYPLGTGLGISTGIGLGGTGTGGTGTGTGGTDRGAAIRSLATEIRQTYGDDKLGAAYYIANLDIPEGTKISLYGQLGLEDYLTNE